MRPSISAPVAQLSSLAVTLLLALAAVAQVNGPPASVTSPGFGGHPVNGPRASVTSVGPRGYAPEHHGKDDGQHRQQKNSDTATGAGWYAIPIPIPYAVDNAATDAPPADGEDAADPQDGPASPDRHGSASSSAQAKSTAPAHPADHAEEAPPVDPDPPLPPTLLVFKDGRTLEVANYAILGQTVYDLTPGHRRKIAIMDLDLEATRKQNDERGVTFELPKGTHAN